MKELTERQRQVLNFIKNEVRKKGYPPSIREICEAVHMKSTSTAYSCLNQLEKKGYIRKDKTKPRAIEIIDPDAAEEFTCEFVKVPILGTIAAGEPLFAVESIEDVFPIPIEYIKNNTVFMLRIKGDSMIGVGIYDRDLVLISQQSSANNGDIVAAYVDGFATIKTFYREDQAIRLQPENPTMSPIILKEVSILGKVIGLYRKF